MEKKLYSWQEDCLKRWFANKGRGMVQAVTGSGKTLLALTAADRLAKTTIWNCASRLLSQHEHLCISGIVP